MNALLSTRVAAALLAFLLAGSSLHAQDVHVLVLDALSAKPQVGASVQYLCIGNYKSGSLSPPVLTDNTGIANLSLSCAAGEKVEIVSDPKGRKEQCGGSPELSIAEIISTGFVSDPTAAGGIWCPNKKSRNIKPTPGQVVIFAKKPTWYQSHIAG